MGQTEEKLQDLVERLDAITGRGLSYLSEMSNKSPGRISEWRDGSPRGPDAASALCFAAVAEWAGLASNARYWVKFASKRTNLAALGKALHPDKPLVLHLEPIEPHDRRYFYILEALLNAGGEFSVSAKKAIHAVHLGYQRVRKKPRNPKSDT